MKKVLITMLAFLQFLVLTAGSAYAADDHHHGRLEKLVVTDTETGRQNHYILYTYNDAGLLSGQYHYLGGEKEYYYSEVYDYYRNGVLRTKRHSGLFEEIHYDAWGHCMDCDYDFFGDIGVPFSTISSDTVREYDTDGNLTRYEVRWNYEEGPEDDRSIIREYKYDESNRIVTVTSIETEPDYYSQQNERKTKSVTIRFSYWDDGSYGVLVKRETDDRDYLGNTMSYIEVDEKGFPLRSVAFGGYDDELEGISVISKGHYSYDEYGNLTQISSEDQDDFGETIDYIYQIENGKPISCDVRVTNIRDGIEEEPVVYSTAYEYNADGEVIRKGFDGHFEDYTYVYDESEEPPALWPDDLGPFVPLFPWG